MTSTRHHPCPVGAVGHLDNRLRSWIHSPDQLFAPYVRPRMHCVDIGCGGGFATMGLARLVGPRGRVVAVDVQRGMLDLVQHRSIAEEHPWIETVQCTESSPNVDGPFDFALMMYMAHEVPQLEAFLTDVAAALSPQGLLYLAEPKLIVSGRRFRKTVDVAHACGLETREHPRLPLSRAVVLGKPGACAAS